MDWTRAHPKRLPTAAEYTANATRMADIDNKIETVNAQIRELEKERLNLQLERANRVAFVAPFRRLPPEIICNITVKYLELGESLYTLTNVCSSMRDAINGFKSLWSTISIVEPGQNFVDRSFGKVSCSHFFFN